MGKITLKELASQLGLSVASVSRALNDSHEISEETKVKVRKLASDLDYRPNIFASSLRNNRSKTLALIIPELSNNFFTQVLKGVEHVANSKGYHVMVYGSGENSEKELSILQHLTNGRVDGILLSTCTGNHQGDHFKQLQDNNIPVVFFDRVLDRSPYSKIVSNDFQSAYLATQHLISKACRKIMFLSAGNHFSNIKNRIKGFERALEEEGESFQGLILDFAGQHDQHQFLRNQLRAFQPDAIFSSVENLAIVTYDVCADLGINIPENLKVLSYSNNEIARHFNPSLTTIVQPAFEMGKNAAENLLRYLKYEKEKGQILVLDSELVVRRSSS